MADEFDNVAKRIRTLTAVLQQLRVRSRPTSHQGGIPKFLSHFITLLTCGDQYSPGGSKVVAATGSLYPDGTARTLIVTQNPHSKSTVSTLTIAKVPQSTKSFQEVATGRPDAQTLQDHISDIRAAIETYDHRASNAVEDLRALHCFVVTRCFRKIAARFYEDRRYFRNRRLFEIIDEWEPDDPQMTCRWVTVPTWLRALVPRLMSIDEQRSGTGRVEWEVSTRTLKKWAGILSLLLKTLNTHIENAKTVMMVVGDSLTDGQRSAIYLMVVPFLLKDISLKDHLSGSMSYLDTKIQDDNEQYDSMPSYDEDVGTSILHYLKALVAWHSALNDLCTRGDAKSAMASLLVGIAEIPYCDSTMLNIDELADGYLAGRKLEDDSAASHVDFLRQKFGHRLNFSGTIHAEATLMGLLAYAHHDQHCNYGRNADDNGLLTEFLRNEDTAVETIAASKKCCWCCEKLAIHLERRLNVKFVRPGSHGLLYTWSPPIVGIDVSVLFELEKDLWSELQTALLTRVAPIISRQSSGESRGTEIFILENVTVDERDIFNTL